MALINSPENGATERPGSSNHSLTIFLAGPIRYWWTPGVEGSELHKNYVALRGAVRDVLSRDFLVYAPNTALRGPWDERAQKINNLAIAEFDVFIYLYADGVPAEGTDEELILAEQLGKTIFSIDVTSFETYCDTTAGLQNKLLALRDELDA